MLDGSLQGLVSLASLAAAVMFGSVPWVLGLVVRECSALPSAPDLLGRCRCPHPLPPGCLTVLGCVSYGMFSSSLARCSQADGLENNVLRWVGGSQPSQVSDSDERPRAAAATAAQREGCVLELSVWVCNRSVCAAKWLLQQCSSNSKCVNKPKASCCPTSLLRAVSSVRWEHQGTQTLRSFQCAYHW